MQYGIVIQPVATIYEIPAETVVKDGMVLSLSLIHISEPTRPY